MYISIKYFIFYTCVGFAVGNIAKKDKKVLIAGAILSAMMGLKFGEEYAILSSLEFCLGFLFSNLINNKNEN